MAQKSAAPFRWKWALLAIPALLALQIGGVTLLALLGELGPGQLVLVSAASYFLGGFLIAYWSPGVTVREPAVGIMVAVILGSLLLRGSGGSVLAGLIALVLGMGGAKVGEFLQARRRAT